MCACMHVHQAGVHGEKQAPAGSAEGAEVRDRISKAGGAAAASGDLQLEGLP